MNFPSHTFLLKIPTSSVKISRVGMTQLIKATTKHGKHKHTFF